jgi:hypothetical protein
MPCKLEDGSLQVQSDIAYLNVQPSETGWHHEQETIRFGMQPVGNDCTILNLSPDQCSPKPNVDSFGSNDKSGNSSSGS